MLVAVYTGRKEIRDLMLARGIALELDEAAAAGQLARVQQLVDKDPAAANEHLEIVKMLLRHGADLHVKTNDGKTARSFAEDRGHAAVAEFLRSRAG